MVRLFGRRRKKTVKLTIPDCECEWCDAQIDIVREMVARLERRVEHLERHLSQGQVSTVSSGWAAQRITHSNYYAGKQPPADPAPNREEGEDA